MMRKTTVHSRKRRGPRRILYLLWILFVLPGVFLFFPVLMNAQTFPGTKPAYQTVPGNRAVPAVPDQDFSKLNRELSLRYTQILNRVRDPGTGEISDSNETVGLIESALLFWPGNPDALYYRALQLRHAGEYDRAIEFLTKALGGEVFQFSDRDEVLRRYLDLLVENDHSDFALTILSSMAPQKLQQQDFLELRAKALQNEGLITALTELVDSGTALFPENDFFRSLQVKYSDSKRSRVRRRILTEPGQKLYGKQTFREIIRGSFLTGQLEDLLAVYEEQWGADNFYRVHILRTVDVVDGSMIEELLGGFESIDGDLLTLLSQTAAEKAGAPAGTDIFAVAFNVFQGRVLRDPDKDGINEVTEQYRDGKITVLEANMDGDPEPELEVVFENEQPVKVTVLGLDEMFFEVEYRRYPELSIVRIPSREGGQKADQKADQKAVQEGGILEIKTVPFSVYYPFPGLEAYAPSHPYPFPDATGLPSLYRLLANAATIEVYYPGETADGDNRKDVALKFYREQKRIEEYRNGKVEMQMDLDMSILERRSIDPDGDGYFEILEFYRGGELYRILYDGNENGVYEYIEEFTPVHIRKWDSNEDGIADYHEN